MDILQNPEMIQVSGSLSNAMSQLREAASSGDNQKATDLAANVERIKQIYVETKNRLDTAKSDEQQRSKEWLSTDPTQQKVEILSGEPNWGSLPATTRGYDIANQKIRDISAIQGKSNDDIRNHLATVLDVPSTNIDVDSGISGSNRFKLGMLRDPKSKLEFLQNTYGQENVTPLNISGNPSFVVKSGDKHILADELGASVSDFTSDIAGEIIPTLGAAIGGYVASGGKNGKVGKIGVSEGAAAGQFIAGSAQDYVTRLSMGLPTDPAEIIVSRGIEAALGYGLDQVGKFIARPLVKGYGGVLNEYASKISDAQKLLASKGVETTAPIMNLFGKDAAERQLSLIGKQEGGIGSRAGTAAQKTLDTLGDFKNILMGDQSINMYQKVLGRLKAQEGGLIAQVEKNDAQAANIVGQHLQKRFDDIAVKDFSADATGNIIRTNLETAKDSLIKIKNDSYDAFYRSPEAQQIKVSRGDLAKIIENGSKTNSSEYRNPEIDRQVSELRELQQVKDKARLVNNKINSSGGSYVPTKKEKALIVKSNNIPDIDAKALDDRVRMAREAGISESFGSGSNQAQVANDAAMAIQKERDRIYSNAGIKDEWDESTKVYQDALGSKAGAVGRALNEKYDSFSKTGTMAINDIVRDPEYINNAINLSKLSQDQAAADITRAGLQNAYLAKLGLTKESGGITAKIDADSDIIKALWGTTDQAGKHDLTAANNIKSKFIGLSNAFEQSKIDISKVKPEEVSKLFSTLSSDESKAVISKIQARVSADQAKDKFVGNSIVNAAKSGGWDIADNDNFSKALFDADISEVNSLVRRMPSNVKPAIQSDFVGRLFKSYPTETSTSSGVSLWDGGKVLKQLESADGDKLKSRIVSIMGNDWFNSFKAASTVLNSNEFKASYEKELALKASTGGGVKSGFSRVYLVGDLLQIGADRVASGLQGIGALEPVFKILAQNVGPKVAEERINKLAMTLATSRPGLIALNYSVRNDPKAAQQLVDVYSKQSENNQQLSNRIKTNLPTVSSVK